MRSRLLKKITQQLVLFPSLTKKLLEKTGVEYGRSDRGVRILEVYK